jgi:hypothetical protein
VLANFGAHGLDVNQLRDMLSGGVFSLTARISKRWRFPKVTRQRLSSHHRTMTRWPIPIWAYAGHWHARSCTDELRPAPGCSWRNTGGVRLGAPAAVVERLSAAAAKHATVAIPRALPERRAQADAEDAA